MTELAYMPFYPADWLLDTQDLSPEAYQAYHRLLCNMWLSRSGTLPDDPAVLRRRAGFSAQKWPHVWREIEGYFDLDQGQVGHQRLSKERTKARATYAARSGAGRKGADAKWRKTNNSGNGRANSKSDDKKMATITKPSIKKGAREKTGPDLGFTEADVQMVKTGKRHLCSQISGAKGRAMIEAGEITADEAKAVGVI